jgi:hypothetical protein
MSRLPKAPRYFGCVGPAGHYVYNPGMGHDRDMNWLAYMDGLLPPEGDQIEGLAKPVSFQRLHAAGLLGSQRRQAAGQQLRLLRARSCDVR